jgi:hypothetical protein
MQYGVYIPPERVHEVERAMPPVYTGKNQNEATPTLQPGNMGKRGRDQMHIQRRVAMDIMQSDVPAEHLQGIMRISTGQRLAPGVRASYGARVMDSKGAIVSANKYAPAPRAQREERRRTLVHEIGHHQDPETHVRHHSTGEVEARAENYADHFTGATRTNPPSTYDDPKNIAIAGYQRTLYSRARVRA